MNHRAFDKNKPAERLSRNGTLDVLRILACCAVIVLHSSGGFIYKYDSIGGWQWNFANIVDSSVRWCVPIFIFLSGVLNVTPNSMHQSSFLQKRFFKIVPIILVWSVIYMLYAGVWSVDKMIARIVYGNPYYHLYFLFLISGLYLFTPAISAYAVAAGDRQTMKTGFLCIFIAVAAWAITEPKMTAFTWFLPFVGYYIIGGPLYRKPLPVKIAVICAIISIAATAVGTWVLVSRYGPGSTGLYLYNYLSPSVVLMSISIFSIFANFQITAADWLTKLSGVTLGVYVLHVMVLETVQKSILFVKPDISPATMIVALSFLTIIGSFALALVGSRIPIVKRLFI